MAFSSLRSTSLDFSSSDGEGMLGALCLPCQPCDVLCISEMVFQQIGGKKTQYQFGKLHCVNGSSSLFGLSIKAVMGADLFFVC